MKLTEMNCERGAPMGRMGIHLADPDVPIIVELEKVPFVDRAYDIGGAYWGAPDNLWCAIGTDEEGEIILEHYLRAKDRDHAMAEIMGQFTATFLPENGSLYEQAIEKLSGFLDTLHPGDDDDQMQNIESDIEIFKDRYLEITGKDYVAPPPPEPVPPTAFFKFSLESSTGYQSDGVYTISPEQYGHIVGALESIVNPQFLQDRFEKWVRKFDLIVDPNFTKDADDVYVDERINEQFVVWHSALTFNINEE